jgi:hypothetical protein
VEQSERRRQEQWQGRKGRNKGEEGREEKEEAGGREHTDAVGLELG